MSSSSDLEVRLKAVQCHFTWNINKSDISGSVVDKLGYRMEFCPIRYHPIYFNIMAFVSHLEGKNGTALGFLSKAEEILKERKGDTELLVTYGNYAWVHYHSDNLEEVRVYLEKVEEITKTLPQGDTLSLIHGQKGWSFLRLGESLFERTKESFEKALKGEPENVSHNAGYAVVLYRLEGVSRELSGYEEVRRKATNQLEKALVLEPDNAEVMVLLALMLQSQQNLDEGRALNLIIRVMEIAPDTPQITRYIGQYFRKAECIETSLRVLHEALEKSPEASMIHHQIGLCHQRILRDLSRLRAPDAEIRTKADDCIRYFSKAVELKPSNIYAKLNLADAYAESQRHEVAERIFKELLEDSRVKQGNLQTCLVKYGLFLMHRKRNHQSAMVQLRLAYQIPIQSNDRKQAGRALTKLAGWMGSWESMEILDFLRDEDDKQREIAEEAARSKMASDDADDLAKKFGKGLNLK